ncbi:MAG TPA: isocitrate lyase/phosphoenolpyruvate mutase family protein [Caulobacteraceae bacterium]|nr:isocitrate lyase/phosphoenolpyruvate mutase family protein [Caulobacteraceae bacterium]
MRPTPADKRAAFRDLHASGCFVLPNPWDVGSAVILQSLGFKALASTSAGYAWSQGRPDYKMARDEVLSHLSTLTHAVDIPVNADFENAFADDPQGVAENVSLAVETGLAGLSVEDSTGDKENPLYDFTLAVERIRAAREAIDKTGTGVVLTARSEGFIAGRPDLDETVRRIRAYAEAGADCLYAPGIREDAQITAIVEAAGGKPVNVLTPGLPVARLAGLGVRRISVGGSLARVAYAALIGAAEEILNDGSFAAFGRVPASVGLNGIFAKALEAR